MEIETINQLTAKQLYLNTERRPSFQLIYKSCKGWQLLLSGMFLVTIRDNIKYFKTVEAAIKEIKLITGCLTFNLQIHSKELGV